MENINSKDLVQDEGAPRKRSKEQRRKRVPRCASNEGHSEMIQQHPNTTALRMHKLTATNTWEQVLSPHAIPEWLTANTNNTNGAMHRVGLYIGQSFGPTGYHASISRSTRERSLLRTS